VLNIELREKRLKKVINFLFFILLFSFFVLANNLSDESVNLVNEESLQKKNIPIITESNLDEFTPPTQEVQENEGDGTDRRHLILMNELSLEEEDYNKLLSDANQFVASIDAKQDLQFRKVIVVYNELKQKEEYHLFYDYPIISQGKTGKRIVSVYPIEIIFDEQQNIVDMVTPAEEYIFFKERGE